MKPTRRLLSALMLAGAGCSWCAAAFPDPAPPVPSPPGVASGIRFDHHILVDQFGYRPQDPKVAVIRTPHAGYDVKDAFRPGPAYEVRRATDGEKVYSGQLTEWNGGAVEESSGDSGWWFDFSTLRSPGTYFVYDVQKKLRSATFRIDPDVYRDVLKAGMRTYFYQRSGFAKQAPFADACWTDGAAYVGPGQDAEAREITDRNNPARARFLVGGWFDAGDTNKYVTFAAPAVHQLLTAYQANPHAFTDDFNIPESGNGVPDLIDEVKWEVDWFKRMQYSDGSAALKVGEVVDATATRPSADTHQRFYIPSCTSATVAASGVFAHAAFVFQAINSLHEEADKLRGRAVAAWKNYQGAPNKQEHCDSGVIRAGNADWSAATQQEAAVVAAVYLFALTGDPVYNSYLASNYRNTRPYRDFGWSRYDPHEGDALLFYTSLQNADPALKDRILTDKRHDVEAGNQVYGFRAQDDLYRAFLHTQQYHWGSNAPRANYGNTNLDVVSYGIGGDKASTYETRALELLHYFHGVNPFGIVYLSNMYRYGATASVNEIYHTWYWNGTRWGDALKSECGPPPGYVPGGPNADAVRAGVPASLVPPAGQPLQKSYRDWNVAWPESSWAVSEPAIYYQSAYIRLLSYFVP